MSTRAAGSCLLKALGIALLVLAPDLAGTVPEKLVWPYRLFCPLVVWLAVRPPSRGAQNFVLAVCMTAASVFAMDLALRLAPQTLFYYRPEDMFLSRWPAMPEILRFKENARFQGRVSGDLVALAGDAQYRQERAVIFQTDRYGFRNAPDRHTRTIDLLLVGDSVGVGMDNSQETAWAELFQARYGLNTYNLSTAGGPWDALMNVQTGIERLRTRPGAVLLWVISASNDLQGQYYEWTVPRRRGPLGRLAIAYSVYRNRSPVDVVVSRVWQKLRARQTASEALAIGDFFGRKALFLKEFLENQRLTAEEVRGHPNFPRLRDVFARMREVAAARDFRVAVILIPPKEAVYEWVLEGGPAWSTPSGPTGLSRELAALAEANGFTYLDAKPALLREAERVQRESGEMLWWADDSHWNPAGHEAAARLAYETLIRPVLPGSASKAP